MANNLIRQAAAMFGVGTGQVDPAKHRRLGDEARDRGDWRGAIDHYRRFLEADPSVFPIWVQLGHATKEAGDLDGAEQAYRRAEALEPDNADLALNLGHLLKSSQRREEAERYYRRSFDLDGNDAARAELQSLGITPTRDVAVVAQRSGGAPVGVIDRVDGYEVRGWAVEPDASGEPARIVMSLAGGRVIGRAIATQQRPDIVAAGITEGPAGFTMMLDAEDLAGETITVEARLASTGEPLEGSPLTIMLPPLGEQIAARRITSARYIFAKPLEAIAGEHAIFVAYAPTGVLQPFVRRFLRLLADQGIAVSLVVNADRPVLLDDDLLASVASAMVRENRGYDFGAWAHMLRVAPQLYGADALYIVNDSIFGPTTDASFSEAIAALRANTADLAGLTETLERGWHIQSYFLRVNARLLSSYAFQLFVNSVHVVLDKDEVINAFEVPLTTRICDAGFTADAVFKVDEARNPTLFAWRRLLDAGFPFIKLLLVRGRFPHISTRGLEKALARAGFDRQLLEATLDYGTDEPLPGGEFPLLARVRPSSGDDDPLPVKPYKVAFYGPWNYDNGLGSASRGIIAAIRQAGVRLNLHPIHKPFHVHKPLTPPLDVIDFDGPADIAIVHLNPDSWHLLTDDQRGAIACAGRRIGYWVWEMEHLPAAWRRDFSSVDRIWAPSAYNAALFGAQDEAPVDVVPHVVPVTPDANHSGAAIRQALGLPTDRRLILYVFDGASYLVRKNPAALLRAFAASGLAERGWSLVLKTKHLMDRPGDGEALVKQAGATDAVILLDRSLNNHELADLVTAGDIYASPHCAEGFGLTVAEAMAAGRAVVATDYSGTTQFLDDTCGYPVKADAWTLDRDFGHYTKGGTWARVDEDALAEALIRAAEKIDAGDTSIGEAGRARIAETLSVQTVGAAVARSLDAVVQQSRDIRRMPPRIDEGAAGVPLAAFEPEEGLSIVPLKKGTLQPAVEWPGKLSDAADEWILFAPEDCGLHPLTQRLLMRRAAARPDVAIFYADDAAFGAATLIEQVRLKPHFDQTMFAAQDYIGVPLFVRASVLHDLGGWDPTLGDAALYALVLRAAEQGRSIDRIAEVVVVSSGDRVVAPRDARRQLIGQSPLYAGFQVADGPTGESLQLEPRLTGTLPAVTLCVPTRRSAIEGSTGTGSYVERLLQSLVAVDWPLDRLTVLIGDDVAGQPDWERAAWPFTVRRIETLRAPEEPFNFSAKMNQLWRAADTEIVLLVNDDIVATGSGWLRALVGFALDRDVGAVGARLLFDDGTIQHAGVYGGVMGTSVHAWLGRRAGAATYMDWAVTQRELSMVTGAMIATRRSVLEAVGGFDERFNLEFNDVDLCLKIRQLGLRIVYNPVAELIHSEKKSRGEVAPPGEQLALFLSRWQEWLSDDPALPPRIRRDMLDLAPAAGPGSWFV
ncbi:rhamnan synthesis F family protein [Sphingomonas sp. TZW2008]|uniref:rhamnan synthesis F family protein n=1 Tax=Sphingomonas sp. TZW2008 TaxID=1917973 RepID=UPI0015C4ECBC|nr:glycosyltransferase [Sphingomonas sp. TZW2008]